MAKKITREYLQKMQNGKTIDTPLLRGSTIEFPVDDVLSIERQNVHIKHVSLTAK